MPTNDLELESVWLLAWAPFAGSSPRDVKYLAHYPHDRAKRALLLNKSLEMTSAIEEYRVADLKGNDRSVAAQRLSSQFVDSVLALFFQIAPLWVGMKVPLSPDCEDIMNLSIATNLVLIEGFFKPILSALNAMNNGLAKNFNSPDAVNNLDAIPLQDLKIELFNELKLLTLNHPYRSGVDRKRISDFLTLHAVPREGYPIDSVVGMFQCALKRIQLKYEKRDFITACSNILGKADVWQQKHHNFAFEEELKLLDECQSDEVGQGKILSKSAQKKRRKKENKLRRIAEKENSQSIRILSASKIQRQIRFYLNTRESAARTLQQYIQSYLQRMQCHRENQAASIISHFIRHVCDVRIQDRAALLIHAFVAKAYYRQKNSLRQNQWWFDQLNETTQHAALVIRDCIEECRPNSDLMLYGSRLLEGSSLGSYVVEDQSDLDLMMVLPSQINSSAFLSDVMFKLNAHAFESSGRLLNIFIQSEKKSIISCQFTAPFGCPSIDLTFVQYNEKSPHANIATLDYLSNNTLHADQFGLVLSGLTLGGLSRISVLSQRRLMRSVSEPNFADIATFSRNQVRNAIKKLLRALCINLNVCENVPESLHPTIFNEATFAKFPLSKAKEILHQEIINLFKNKVALLKDLLNYRALNRFYGLLPRVLRKDFVEFSLFDPLTLFQDKTPFADNSPYSMMFAVQHFLFQADCINRSNYSDAMLGPLRFLNAYVDVIWRMGMSELWNDCVMLYRSLDKRSEFVNDYAVCRGQLFALKPIMHPCEVSQVSSYESYNTSDGDTSTLSTLS